MLPAKKLEDGVIHTRVLLAVIIQMLCATVGVANAVEEAAQRMVHAEKTVVDASSEDALLVSLQLTICV